MSDPDSQGEPSPDELPLDEGAPDGAVGQCPQVEDGGADGLGASDIDELPLSPPDLQEALAQEAPQHTEVVVHHPCSSAEGGEGGETTLVATGDAPERCSLLKRRGRRRALVHDEMAALLQRAGAEQARPSGAHSAQNGPGGVLACENIAFPKARVKALTRDTNIRGDAKGDLVLVPIRGICRPSPLGPALEAASSLGSAAADEELDSDLLQFGRKAQEPSTLPVTSKSMLAVALGIDKRKLDVALQLFGSALFHDTRFKRAKLEEAFVLQCAKDRLVMYVDFSAYDETPLPVSVRGEVVGSRAPAALGGDGSMVVCASKAMCSLEPGFSLQKALRSSSGPKKVLQTVQRSGMLLAAEDGFLAVVCPAVCPLQVLDQCTGVALQHAQLLTSPVTKAASLFQHTTRVVCTDRCAANLAAERGISVSRGHDPSLHIACEVHKTAGCFTKTFELLPDNIRGMIHAAMALESSGAMARFRACLADEIASRFVIKSGKPSQEALRYKRGVLRLFVSHGACLAQRQILLVLCPNGDWRSRKVEHFVAPGELATLDHDARLKQVIAGVTAALCSSQPEVYPRHRWTGADLATDRFGVIEACHCLLTTTFLRFAASYEHHSRARRLLAAAGASGGAASSEVGLMALEDMPRVGHEEDAGGHAGLAFDLEAGGAEAPPDEQAWAAVNATHRRIATEWVVTKPLPKLMLQRLVMEPLRQLMSSQFWAAGDDFDLQQLHRVLSAAAQGDHQWNVREYRVCIAALGIEEMRFFDQVRMLYHSELMASILPQEACTTKFRALAFKMISRMACGVAELIRHPHKQMPFQLFKLLVNPDEAEHLLQIPPCMWDAWSAKMRELHPTLRGDVLLNKLALVAQMLWKDISQVESKHATIRRMLTVSSVQTHPQTINDLSALWCMHQVRKIGQVAAGGQMATGVTKKATTGRGSH